MTTRFSPATDLTVPSLLPRPCPDGLTMDPDMRACTCSVSVAGLRQGRGGDVGPALIDIAAARDTPGYLGTGFAECGGRRVSIADLES